MDAESVDCRVLATLTSNSIWNGAPWGPGVILVEVVTVCRGRLTSQYRKPLPDHGPRNNLSLFTVPPSGSTRSTYERTVVFYVKARTY